jgi:hypothetical protein
VLSLTGCSERDVMQNYSYCLVLSTVTLDDFVVEKQDEDHGWYCLRYQMDNYQCKTHFVLCSAVGVRTLSWTSLHMQISAAGALL